MISYPYCTGAVWCLGWGLGTHLKITFVMTKAITKVTTTSRSAVTNLMRNLSTTQSMGTTQMTHTDDAHSLVSGVTRVFCVKVRFEAVLPNRGSPDTTLSYIHSPAPYFSYLGESPNGRPAR